MKHLLLPLSMIFLASCVQKPILPKAEWLLGTWTYEMPNDTFFERWTKDGALAFQSEGFQVKNQDTILVANAQIQQLKDQLFYTATIENGEGSMEVKFTLRNLDRNILTFQNLDHPFPQIITYHLIHQDSMVGELSGNLNGSYQSKIFPMKRID